MNRSPFMHVRPEVAEAVERQRPVVALESTLIVHGLPWPLNLETALAAEAAVRAEGAVPATIAIWEGKPVIGLDAEQLHALAQQKNALKASRRDLAVAVSKKLSAATTVAATMYLANLAGIRLFATGGIGGAHRDSTHSWDVSADVSELARTPVAVVCSGAKSILDIPKTLQVLETASVPVIGYGTDEFPAFYIHSSGEPITARVDSPRQAADLLRAHWNLGGAGVILAQPIDPHVALEPESFMSALSTAEEEAVGAGVHGKELTPFLLSKLAEITEGQTLRANHTLVLANARLAAQVARSLWG
ncbi:MAG: pseudouridine-5'-phosphate glycosidase [Gemmataceae bacterium]|nr:pseudouridine-5'-phosphate glycosidase [Gemmataceae bacterium]MCI0741782.1 pseudouridine-5'-phosphate glycosidase [Gemmataceae bacterium]